MSQLTFKPNQPVSLKGHSEFDEKWLQDRIAENPTILGLGEVVVIDRERSQERAGRLDLLLSSPEQDRRFEVEVILGATDASHIIRCIEYWDIERRRYPGYEHCAVLIAEDITSRFLNVIGLLAGTVPLVAIQINALRVGEHITLDFVRVLDQRLLRRDDTSKELGPLPGGGGNVGGGRGRASVYSGKIIVAKHTDDEGNLVNPRRKGTWGERSYNIILEAPDQRISYEDYKAKGGRNNDLKWDYDHDYVGIVDAEDLDDDGDDGDDA